MRKRDQTFLTDIVGPEDSAIESVVSRYQRVAPAITRFARTLAKNPNLKVRLGSESASSEDEIVCDPRIFQAAYTRNAPVTPDEVALASALHEAMHLVNTNLDEKRTLPEGWPVAGEAPGDAAVDVLTALDSTNRPVAEVLFFSLEDARQERQGLEIYPGARSVLVDLYASSLTAAVTRSAGLSQRRCITQRPGEEGGQRPSLGDALLQRVPATSVPGNVERRRPQASAGRGQAAVAVGQAWRCRVGAEPLSFRLGRTEQVNGLRLATTRRYERGDRLQHNDRLQTIAGSDGLLDRLA